MQFPVLAVLERIVDRNTADIAAQLSRTVFVCVQHLLESTGSLLECLIRCGVPANQIYVQGKVYSTSPEVLARVDSLGITVHGGTAPASLGQHSVAMKKDVDELWRCVLCEERLRTADLLIVLDDGGHCISGIPRAAYDYWRVVAIEQTTSGLQATHSRQCPVIAVASSAAKRLIEPPMIAAAILSKLKAVVPGGRIPQRCGVIGFGNIGAAVARSLVELRHQVYVFDIDKAQQNNSDELQWLSSAEELIAATDIIFGSTGKNVIEPEWLLKHLQGPKMLISCSSGDVEFRSALDWIGYHDRKCHHPLGSIEFALSDGDPMLTIARGGFPVNFDRTPESVPAKEIQLTRGLMLGAVMQAVLCESDNEQRTSTREIMLNPVLQQFVVRQWLQHSRHHSKDAITTFFQHEAIRAMSSGQNVDCKTADEMFSNNDT